MRAQGVGNRFAIAQAESFIEAAAEAAIFEPLGAEEGTVQAGAGIGEAENIEEQTLEAIITGNRHPLNLVLIAVGIETEQLGDAAVEIAERVRVILLLIERHVRTAGVPDGATAEIAGAIESEDRRLLKRRRIVGRGGVRQVVLDDRDAAIGKAGAELEMEAGLRHRPDYGDRIHLLRLGAGQFQTGGDGLLGQLAGVAAGAAHQLGFFDGGDQLAIFQNSAGGVAGNASDSQNDHAFDCPPFSRFSSFAKVSRRATVRLKTGPSGVESGSTQKYPRRSN